MTPVWLVLMLCAGPGTHDCFGMVEATTSNDSCRALLQEWRADRGKQFRIESGDCWRTKEPPLPAFRRITDRRER